MIIASLVVGCNQTKYVPKGKYLLKKNEIVQKGDKLDKDDLTSIVRQQPNYKSFGVKWKLFAYNRVDSAKVADKRKRKNEKIRSTNRKRLVREDYINAKRIQKAASQGKTFYTHKTIPLKDTANPRMFFREWYKYKIGRSPVVFDSIPFEKSKDQLNAYLRSKGYYYGDVHGTVEYKENGKCVVNYLLNTGKQYIIDSVYLLIPNQEVEETYEAYVGSRSDPPLVGKPFDSDILKSHRNDVSRFMRDSSFYGFNSTHINFIADTTAKDLKVNIGVQIGDRVIKRTEDKDSVLLIPQRKTKIKEVFFHLADTLNFEGDFSAYIDSLGLPLYDGQFLRTIDTVYYDSRNDRGGRDAKAPREAVVLYNGKLIIKPRVLEVYNYLDKEGAYSDKGVESSYNGLLRLGLFNGIKTQILETEDPNYLEAHYYLVPGKKQSFGFEPRATNSNGFLGVSASINYTNRNLFRGAERLTLSLSGGFESQPAIFDEDVSGEKIKTAGRSFNTFEFGPSAELMIPGFFPFRSSRLAKKRRPETIVSSAYNYQSRSDFVRGTFQMNYDWKFIVSKTQIFEIGLPGVSVIKFVNIDKSTEFEDKLIDLNDLFLLDAYSNQFIWQDWKLAYEYNIKEKKNRRGNSQLYFKTSFDAAGNILSLFNKYQDTLANGQKGIWGVQYAQFLRLDNELIFSKPLGKERSLNMKLLVGGGVPYGNTENALPYDYSFFAGGSNDNRGWRARALGPGSYKYYLDTTRTSVQIGDFRLGGSAEFRFPINSFLRGAVFMDAGNVWTMFYDENRPGGQLSKDWYKEIALAAGVGLRVDFEYFIVRVDLGFPIKNPALPIGAQWVFEPRHKYYDEIMEELTYIPDSTPLPFIPHLHFGIGYPF